MITWFSFCILESFNLKQLFKDIASAGFQLFQDATGKATTIGWHAVIFNNAVGGKTWVVRTPAHSYLPPPVSSLHLLVCGSR